MKKAALYSFPWLLLSLALILIMPSSDSLWVDEAQTWSHVATPNLETWFRNLTENGFSEALMPLGMLLAWIFGKILGTTEWALRAPNLLWTALATVAFWRIGVIWRAPWACLLFAVQPFVWFYTDEARPYALQIACGAWMVLCVVECMDRQEVRLSSLLVLLATSLVLTATTLFGIVTVAAVAIVFVWGAWRCKWQLPPKWPLWVGGAMILTLACGFYYYSGLRRGATGAKIWNPGISNLAFVFYEFGGFTGFGPGREQLRETVRSGGIAGVLRSLYLSVLPLALLAVFHLAASVRLVVLPDERRRELIMALGGVFASVVLATTLLAFVAKFPFWGRHLAPVFPFFTALLVLALQRSPGISSAVSGWVGLTSVLGIFLLSSFQLRFAERHRKDDYRNAAAASSAALAQGKTVWWIADQQGGRYYGLNFSETTGQGIPSTLFLVTPDNQSTLEQSPLPDVIILSKPDVYDSHGIVRKLLEANKFRLARQLKAFTIWEHGADISSPVHAGAY